MSRGACMCSASPLVLQVVMVNNLSVDASTPCRCLHYPSHLHIFHTITLPAGLT